MRFFTLDEQAVAEPIAAAGPNSRRTIWLRVPGCALSGARWRTARDGHDVERDHNRAHVSLNRRIRFGLRSHAACGHAPCGNHRAFSSELYNVRIRSSER